MTSPNPFRKNGAPRMPDAAPDACIAHGCPRRATIFDTVIGPRSNGRCRYHDAASPKLWPRITEVLATFPPEDIEGGLRMFALELREPKPLKQYPGGFRTKSGHLVHDAESFAAWFADFKANPPPCKYPDQVGPFIRLGAIPSIARPIDRELLEERRGIQSEGRT